MTNRYIEESPCPDEGWYEAHLHDNHTTWYGPLRREMDYRVIGWCEAHGASVIPALGDCGAGDETPHKVVSAVVLIAPCPVCRGVGERSDLSVEVGYSVPCSDCDGIGYVDPSGVEYSRREIAILGGDPSL